MLKKKTDRKCSIQLTSLDNGSLLLNHSNKNVNQTIVCNLKPRLIVLKKKIHQKIQLFINKKYFISE